MLELKLTEKEKVCLNALEETCKKYEMENDYCVGSTSEQRVCICKRDSIWEVFIVERGIEFEKSKHEECIHACLEVIRSCSYCIQEFKDASNEFKNILAKNKQNKLLKKV